MNCPSPYSNNKVELTEQEGFIFFPRGCVCFPSKSLRFCYELFFRRTKKLKLENTQNSKTKMNVADLLMRLDDEANDVQSISLYLHEDMPLDLTFTTFVSKICQKIGSLIGTEETVHPDLTHFKLELASFLRELQCPFENLIVGESDQRLEHPADRKCLVEFLVSEYIAAKRVSNQKDQKNHRDLTSLHALLHCLKLGQPPNDVQVQVLFSTMINRIHSMSAPMKAQVISEPLFAGGKLSESQWKHLAEVYTSYLLPTSFIPVYLLKNDLSF